MKMRGVFIAELREAGRVVARWTAPNLVTDAGVAHVADCMSGRAGTRMTYMAVGDGTGQDAASTTLDNELARIALDATYGEQGTGAADADVGRDLEVYEVVYKATFAAGTGTGTLSEFAVFNANAAGTMLNYATGFSYAKGVLQDLLVWYVLTLG